MKQPTVGRAAKVSRILLVDDSKNGLLARKSVLEEHGYEVHAYLGPLEALAEFQQQSYDLVVTDYRMPRMTGTQLIGEIRSLKPGIPIVLISSLVDVVGLDEKGTGANVVIPKSSTEIMHLVRAVKRLLSSSLLKKPPRVQQSGEKQRKKSG